jgi:hypothetical protein
MEFEQSSAHVSIHSQKELMRNWFSVLELPSRGSVEEQVPYRS